MKKFVSHFSVAMFATAALLASAMPTIAAPDNPFPAPSLESDEFGGAPGTGGSGGFGGEFGGRMRGERGERGGRGGRGGAGGGGGGEFKGINALQSLTPQQRTQIKGIQDSVKQRMQPIHEQFRALKQQDGAGGQATSDDARREKMSQLRRQMRESRMQAWTQMKAVLTPEQLQELDAKRQERMSQFKNARGGGMGGGMGDDMGFQRRHRGGGHRMQQQMQQQPAQQPAQQQQ
jgi:Spy/CpxP family protein refolding chaperone